ncbi:NADH-quinone oxidoreductase subunit NuoG [Vreelandella subglaciescola]|jgi:NADH-quinone oxidoreductase subunit G|uniref:NADH-quinone oxidoreductase subunit G n=1 Tax=Vreelandella subglaciescola TaxID=29571 RepID=A0A1M7IM52_9GAMM|nr:NADH-quinone oxidoreductase subunit NuoG [Halomonas subglaciescola]SHM41749.1 NADH dehydrogenase subunit G [Halomonas subglaciescola]
MATIHVDGSAYDVDGSDNLLHACLSLGLDIPYFCWHPATGSVGACRQCAVKQYKDEDDTQGKIVMSCMTPASDNSWISIDDEEAHAFRARITEWFMTYHPHDCPVCAEGGHCHLQDMTVMTGHSRRRYRFTKRTHHNQYLGPLVAHEMNRCINCYRCVHFYNDYAGGEDFGVYGMNNNLYFGRHQEGVLESPFAGNLSEVCPTGVFTDKTHTKHYTRKWDLQYAPSVCHQCSVGCNTSPGERYGSVRRIENRYNGELNGYFLCDRGRYGHDYVNRDDRPRQPEWKSEGKSEGKNAGHSDRDSDVMHLDVDPALDRGADLLRSARRIIGIGSPRASLESNHQLMALVGKDNFSSGIAAGEQDCLERMAAIEAAGALATPTPRDVERHDAVLVLGEDLMHSAARLALNVRQAVLSRRVALAAERGIPEWNTYAVNTLAQGSHHPLYIAYPTATELDGISAESLRLAPDDIARLGFAIAHEIDAEAPAVSELDDATRAHASAVAEALLAAERPLVISGGSLESPAILDATHSIVRALARRERRAGLLLVRREANSTGLALMGGQPLDWALDAVTDGHADALVVLENDLYERMPEARVDAALDAATALVVLDHQRTRTWKRAELGLPAASFAETDGTLVNLEGRAQRFYQVYDPRYMRPECRIHPSWRWLDTLRASLERRPKDALTFAQAMDDCAQAHPALAGMLNAVDTAELPDGIKLARMPHRYSGRTSLRANIAVSEPRVPQDPDTPLAFSMEGYSGFDRPRQNVPFAWAPGWNSPQAWNKFTDVVGGHLQGGDPGARVAGVPRPADGAYPAADAIPAAFAPRDDRWQLWVLPRLFGGEATSARADAIAERAEAPYLGLSESDAQTLKAADGATLAFDLGGEPFTLSLRVDKSLPDGIVTLPAGVFPDAASGRWVQLRREDD